jgi:hypothetical protein
MEKITLTKLYDVLAQKVGRSEAECLTQYVEIKVKDELNNKTEILATKKDVFALKEDIHTLHKEISGEIHSLRTEMKDNSLALQKWMLATFITLVTMIMGLYAINLFKH